MIRTTYRIALMFVAGLAFGTVFALMAVSARADVPIISCRTVGDASCIDRVTGSRADGFTVTLAGGESFTTGSLHQELRRADGRKGRALVRAAMRGYVSARNAA